jgi:hypothetical protein
MLACVHARDRARAHTHSHTMVDSKSRKIARLARSHAASRSPPHFKHRHLGPLQSHTHTHTHTHIHTHTHTHTRLGSQLPWRERQQHRRLAGAGTCVRANAGAITASLSLLASAQPAIPAPTTPTRSGFAAEEDMQAADAPCAAALAPLKMPVPVRRGAARAHRGSGRG